jgi:D-arabinose 1-dehydrogenase-like Zn-dependent alcohol dehydrogenase
VCRTDLHITRRARSPAPADPGHQAAAGRAATAGSPIGGPRHRSPRLGWADGTCAFCTSGREPSPERQVHRLHLDGGEFTSGRRGFACGSAFQLYRGGAPVRRSDH